MIYIQLIEGMSVVALSAYICTRFQLYKNAMRTNSIIYKINLIVFFSILSIIGTFLGVNVKPFAIANTRSIGTIMAGYIGGPFVGLAVGLIAGTHRYTLGGFTAAACAIATVFQGLIGGIANQYSKKEILSSRLAFLLGIIAQITEMFIILIVARPFETAVSLEKIIAIPMIIINTLGVVIFVNIINNIRNEYAKISSVHAQKALSIAKRTLNTIKLGLDENTAKKIIEIISETGEISDVFLGNKTKILAYVGDEEAKKLIEERILNFYEYPIPQKISFSVNKKKFIFFCSPLKIEDKEFEGVLGVKINSEKNTMEHFTQFCSELSDLLSIQLEIYRLNKLAKEANTARLKVLRAQIHPHFLFNALNTISYFCRIDAEKARMLIVNLSNFLRNTLKREEDFIEIAEEIKSITAYLAIEKARFGDRLNVDIKIPEDLLAIKIPTFIFQPLVENSIKHGILEKSSGGKIIIKACRLEKGILFSIEDNGVGMDESRLMEIKNNGFGIGLKNVNERLKLLYGEKSMLIIESSLNKGTIVSFYMPI